MGEALPKLTLVWMYEGDDLDARRKAVAALDYPEVDLISPDKSYPLDQLVDLMSPDAEFCVFWSDDDKPVGSDFLKLMVRPLLADEQPPPLTSCPSGPATLLRCAARRWSPFKKEYSDSLGIRS
jgi:hypothetical protein